MQVFRLYVTAKVPPRSYQHTTSVTEKITMLRVVFRRRGTML